jgi:hypothetical protein
MISYFRRVESLSAPAGDWANTVAKPITDMAMPMEPASQ